MFIVDEFGPSGTTLWADLHEDDDDADMTVLIVEACRMVDRLDRLNSAIRTGGVFDLIERDEGVVEVRLDNALSEARQHAGALQRILAEIQRRRSIVAGPEEPDGLAGL